jgi:predicted nucleic acid-binding protein
MAVLNRILGRPPFPHVFELSMVTGPIFRRAVALFEEHADRPLSFTDATTIATMRTRRLDRVMSFDKDFDGIVPRVDPRRIE